MREFKKSDCIIIFTDGPHQSFSFFWVSGFIFESGATPLNIHTTYVTRTTDGCGLAIPLSSAISPFLMQLTASSAALSAGIASASSFSQSVLIALASFAINYASASSAATDVLILSAASVSLLTIMSCSSVSLPFETKIGCKSVSCCYMTVTFFPVFTKHS